MKKIRLDLVDVPRPCPEPWEAMTGTDRERACGACNIPVHDLTAMTASEAERLLRDRHDDRLCIRFARGADGHVITVDRPDRVSYQRRSIVRMSMAALTALLGFAGPNRVLAAVSRAPLDADRSQAAEKNGRAVRRDGRVSGTVSDGFSGMADMPIVAINERTGDEFTTKTDANGRYHLALPKGPYLVTVDGLFMYLPFSAQGFQVGPASVLNVTMRRQCMGECVESRKDSGAELVIKWPARVLKKLLGK